MRVLARLASSIFVTLAAVALPACGGGGSSGDFTPGVGFITLTAFNPNPLNGCAPQGFSITGTNFATVTGTTAQVTFRAVDGTTPFAGGTSKTATVTATVLNDTTIIGVTPALEICGLLGLTLEIDVALESGVHASSSGSFFVTVLPPAVTTMSPSSFPAEIATPFTITGTGFGPFGTPVTIRFTGDSIPNLFGHGTLPYVDVLGSVSIGNTEISAISP